MAFSTITVNVGTDWTLITNEVAMLQFNDEMQMSIVPNGSTPSETIGLLMQPNEKFEHNDHGVSVWAKGYAGGTGHESVRVAKGVRSTKTVDFGLEVARGKVPGAEPFGAFGEVTSSIAGTNRVIWANGDFSIPNQTTGEQISIQSTSVEDGVGGTGIQEIHLHYLDANLDPQFELVTTNGQTSVLTVATNIRFIQCAHMAEFGTAKQAVGNISFTDIAESKTYNEIGATYNRCSSSARMVPRGKRAMVAGVVGSTTSGASKDAKIAIASTYFEAHDYTADGVFIPFGTIAMQDTGIPFTFPIPVPMPEGTIIALIYSTGNAGLLITGDWFGWLEDAI